MGLYTPLERLHLHIHYVESIYDSFNVNFIDKNSFTLKNKDISNFFLSFSTSNFWTVVYFQARMSINLYFPEMFNNYVEWRVNKISGEAKPT